MGERTERRIAAIAIGTLTLLLAGTAGAQAATITVNSSGDAVANDGACVLREAIVAANDNTASGAAAGECAAGGPSPIVDEIDFTIPGGGPHTIAPATAYEALVEPVRVDGSTDGGDEIRIDGAATTGGASGLDFQAGAAGSAVTALTVTRFDSAATAWGISSSAGGLVIEDSYIGTNRAGAAGLGNDGGVRMLDAGGVIRDSWISGNAVTGVSLDGGGHALEGNLIGLEPGAGGTALANGGDGVRVEALADEMRIGGPDPGDGNRISGNASEGIEIDGISATAPDAGAFDHLIQGNLVGTSNNGEQAVPNGEGGIRLVGNVSRTEIRDNVVSGNAGEGIQLITLSTAVNGQPGPSDNTIAGNLIGTDVDGESDLGNATSGVEIISAFPGRVSRGNVIGGANTGGCDGDCNLISGNGFRPFRLLGAVADNEILGNVIGLDADGLEPIGNGLGPALQASLGNVPIGNRIGAPGAGNVVAANSFSAIELIDAEDSVVQANLIGIAVDGITPRANGGDGIELGAGASRNLIGGTARGEGNLILFSDASGVAVTGGAGNSILGNTINVNDELGIDLAGGIEDALGVTDNDALDADVGANDLQNHPEIVAAVAGDSTSVVGSLESEPDSEYRIEVFSSHVADSSGHGEGRTLLEAFELTTDANGVAVFARTLGGETTVGEAVTATATSLGESGEPLSTSEFSEARTAAPCDVTGTEGDDVLSAAAGEVACGFGGDDVVSAVGGEAMLVGGEGDDTLDLSGAASPVGATLMLPGGLAELGIQLLAFEGFEHAIGTGFDDEITGDGAGNELDGGEGADTLEGGDGADTLLGQDAADTVKGQAGADTVKGQKGTDDLTGGRGGDELRGGDGGQDDVDGNDGTDSLNGGDGAGDDCNGGPKRDETPAPGCESQRSIP